MKKYRLEILTGILIISFIASVLLFIAITADDSCSITEPLPMQPAQSYPAKVPRDHGSAGDGPEQLMKMMEGGR